MVATQLPVDLTPWEPVPTVIPQEWRAQIADLAQKALGSPHEYVLDTKYDAQGVGDLLCSWGLPLSVALAGYLYEYENELLKSVPLGNIGEVRSHIKEARRYIQYIEDENLPPLLTPPYDDLGALLIAVAANFQALKKYQQQNKGEPYGRFLLARIEKTGRALLNITKRLGMWYLKREVEDVTEQLRSPGIFEEDRQDYERIRQQDDELIKQAQQVLEHICHEMIGQPVKILATFCKVGGLKRRLQDAHTTITSDKAQVQLSGFDLVTFKVIVPKVEDCYRAFGALSHLGFIQDRVTDLIANPKPNGCSHIAFGLILNKRHALLRDLPFKEDISYVCQLQISTHPMQAITDYGCLYPDCYYLYTYQHIHQQIEIVGKPPTNSDYLSSREGNVFLTIHRVNSSQWDHLHRQNSIVVYDKSRNPHMFPVGTTVLDFAYTVGSEIGNVAVEAIVNNRKAPLFRVLEAGDVVEIIQGRQDQVSSSWLDDNYANTHAARQEIKEAIDRRNRGQRGYNLLRQELTRYHFMLTPEKLDEELRLLLRRFDLGSRQKFLERLDKNEQEPFTPEWAAREIMKQIAEHDEDSLLRRGRSTWVPVLDTRINGIHELRVCGQCRPSYPQDAKIVGRLRKGTGRLIVHKDTCAHLIDHPIGRHSVLLPVSWQLQSPPCVVAFSIIVQDRKGLIFDLAKMLRHHRCELVEIQGEAVSSRTGVGHLHFTVEAHSEKEIVDIWEELYHIENVVEVIIDAAHTRPQVREELERLRQHHEALATKTPVEFVWEESISSLPARSQVLQNPFDISRPASGKMFFGRSEEIKLMQRELCQGDQGRAMVIYGPRRSGKSSLCKNFLDRYLYRPQWGVLFSLQNAKRQKETMVLMQLAERIVETFQGQFQHEVAGWDAYHDGDPHVRFKRIVQKCLALEPGSRLILLLDEFGGAIESYEKHHLGLRFFTYWRELLSEIPQLSLVFVLPTSSHRTLRSKRFANAFNFAQSLPLEYLDVESAKRLLADPLNDLHIAIHPNTVTLAFTLTGGNPYYMTLLGQQIIHQLNRDTSKQVVSDKDLYLAVEQLIGRDGFQNFDYLRAELQFEEEFTILAAMIDFMSHSKQAEIQLKKIAFQLGLPVAIARRYLTRLCHGLLLDENSPSSNPFYSFKVDLVRRWLIRNPDFFTTTT